MLIAGLLAACAPANTLNRVDMHPVPGPVWALRTLQGERVTVRPGNAATVRLGADHTVSGTVGCNSTSFAKLRWLGSPSEKQGTFDRSGRGAGITTTVGCGDREALEIGNQFWDLLETARVWSVDRHDLVIEFADGSKARLILLAPQ